jgi:hypothetical protein
MALLVSGNKESREDDLRHSRKAADWIAAIQRPDGRLPVSQFLDAPGWTTPYAILFWCALGVHEIERARSIQWLLSIVGTGGDRDPGARGIVGHDGALPGWPWVEGTHSWVEPTAMSVLALSRAGLCQHTRVARATQMILDRALPHGGWNCGNKFVFGCELRPQPVPTAVSLLALLSQRNRSEAISRGLEYLQRAIAGLRAPISLGWSLLALRAYGAAPPGAAETLGRAFAEGPPIESVRSLALLLLASCQESPSLFPASDASWVESQLRTKEIRRESS